MLRHEKYTHLIRFYYNRVLSINHITIYTFFTKKFPGSQKSYPFLRSFRKNIVIIFLQNRNPSSFQLYITLFNQIKPLKFIPFLYNTLPNLILLRLEKEIYFRHFFSRQLLIISYNRLQKRYFLLHFLPRYFFKSSFVLNF